MEALVLDTNFQAVGIMDVFESFIWTDRFFSYGDFEIYTPMITDALQIMKYDYYLWFKESQHVMIVEGLEIDTDVEDGAHLTITGRSLESILDRRIIWKQTNVNDTLQNGIKKLLDENAISPSDENRKIPNLIFKESTDEYILGLTLEGQYSVGDNLYETISKICELNQIGFRVTLNDDNQFIFELYTGIDRSYNQTANPYVVFSQNFNNIINSNYLGSKAGMKNITLVAGEGEGSNRKTVSVGEGVGLDRREMFTDASCISTTTESGTLSATEYTKQLTETGQEDLAIYGMRETFDGELDSNQMYVYGEDFFIGDIVQMRNEFNMEARTRVTEMIWSQDGSGFSNYPAFSVIEEKEG